MLNLTHEQKTVLIPQGMDHYLKENNTTQAELSRLAGVDKAYVNQILQGRTTIGNANISDKYYRNIAQAIGLPIEQNYWKHFDTFNFLRASRAIEKARSERERLGIDGNSGVGKTYIAYEYKRRYPKECILVKCSGSQTGKEFAQSLAKLSGASEMGSKNALIERACQAIKEIPNAFVIVDEFENAKTGIIPLIKEIADALEGKVPVILIGIDVQKKLQRASAKAINGFVQVNRRWSWKWTLLESDISQDIDLICDELNIPQNSARTWLKTRVIDFDSLKSILTTTLQEAHEQGEQITGSFMTKLFL